MVEVNGLRQSDGPRQAVMISSCLAEYQIYPKHTIPNRIKLWRGGDLRTTVGVGACLRDSWVDEEIVGRSN